LLIKDTVLALLSDMHTGGSTALFTAKTFRGRHQNASPNPTQKRIRPLWLQSIREIAQARKNKRLIVVNLGDATDGFHHNSIQESLFGKADQAEAHVEIMWEFLEGTGFSKRHGDQLHYVQGTEIHTGDIEEGIAKELRAEKNTVTGLYVSDILTLNINGSIHRFQHHGRGRGEGANEGNQLRNSLRNVYFDRQKEGLGRLDVIWSGHTHAHAWESWNVREGDNFHTIHEAICKCTITAKNKKSTTTPSSSL